MTLTAEQVEVIEGLSQEVLTNLDLHRLPVDPLAIAAKEGIRLAPGSYDGCFDGRIEYHSRAGKFILYYADETPFRNEGRVRFSVAHELGHYYIAEHREYLLSGVWHGSHADFVSDNRLEREADCFAASLLMPSELFRQTVRNLGRLGCNLQDLANLADRFRTSLTSTAIRYCQHNFEATSVILSRKGRVCYHVPSEDMRRLGFGFVPYGTPVPRTSKTGTLLARPSPGRDIVEGKVDAEVWFDGRWGAFWEEAMSLGSTGLLLTYLTRDQES